MAEVIGVRFKQVGKVYYFDPAGVQVQKEDSVIVETARGVECGEVAMENRQVSDESIVKPLKKVIRKATKEDLAQVRKNQEKQAAAAKICNEKIAAHKLDMKLVDVEYTFDNNKILFYFTADGRVDFRELVKDLASVFRTVVANHAQRHIRVRLSLVFNADTGDSNVLFAPSFCYIPLDLPNFSVHLIGDPWGLVYQLVCLQDLFPIKQQNVYDIGEHIIVCFQHLFGDIFLSQGSTSILRQDAGLAVSLL